MQGQIDPGLCDYICPEQLPPTDSSSQLPNDSLMSEGDGVPDQLASSYQHSSMHLLQTMESQCEADPRDSTSTPSLASNALPTGAAAKDQYTTFAHELKTLTLEATAERHLGSSSGLSFAKLTQTVLRRLSPDKADFVFAVNQEDTVDASFFSLSSPSDLFNETIYQALSESISVHPLLFGDLFLADIAECNIDIVDLAWPSDERHVRHLVDFYFAHSHTLYPILAKDEILQALDEIQGQPQNLASQSALQNFRLWMVLAIGSTAYSSLSLTEESESMLYYSKALFYVDQALEQDEMVC